MIIEEGRTFTITAEEYARYKKWKEEIAQKREAGNYFGAIGGEDEFIFTPTSIGTIVEVQCGSESIVLRDLD